MRLLRPDFFAFPPSHWRALPKPGRPTAWKVSSQRVRRNGTTAKALPSSAPRTDFVTVEHFSPSITRLTLTRPSSLNALSVPLILDLVSVLNWIHHEPTQRIVILQGAGSRAFSAGADLKATLAPKTHTGSELRTSLELLQKVTALISGPYSRVISIAAVQGHAVGGGAEVALGCDFVIADPSAKFQFPEASLGFGVTGAVTKRLAASIGVIRAKDLLLTGRTMGAEEGLRAGLLTEVVQNPKERARELAGQLEGKPAIALRSIKLGVEKAVFKNQDRIMKNEMDVATSCIVDTMSYDRWHVKEKSQLEQNTGAEQTKTTEEVVASTMQNDNKAPGPAEDPAQDGEFWRSTATIHAEASDSTGTLGQEDAAVQKFRDTVQVVLKEPISQTRNLSSLLFQAAIHCPENVFLRFGETDVTYSSFLRSVQHLASGLRKKGVRSGDRVMVMMRNSIEMVETWFAANWIGAIWVPLNPELRSSTLRAITTSVSAKLTIVDHEFRDLVPAMPIPRQSVYVKHSKFIRRFSSEVSDENFASSLSTRSRYILNVPGSASDISTLIFTSGTTGPSKACSLSHEYFVRAAESISAALKFRNDDVFYCPFPLSHIDATALTIVPALRLGATAAISQRFSVPKFWDEIRKSRATVYDFMGGTLALLYKAPPQPEDLDTKHNVRLAWGVPLSASWAEDYERRFGHKLYEVYGSSESGLPIAQDASGEPQKPRVLGSCGRALPGYELRIADISPLPGSSDFNQMSMESVPPGTPGQLLIRSEYPNTLFSGYFGNEEATKSVFHECWLRTGDICRMNEGGDVFFVGRLKEMVRRMGENVSCAEVEDEFLNHPIVKEVAARGVPSPLGEMAEDALKVLVVLKERDETQTSAEDIESKLWGWAKENLSRHHVPDVIQIMDELKRTSTGKVDRSQLPEQGGISFSSR